MNKVVLQKLVFGDSKFFTKYFYETILTSVTFYFQSQNLNCSAGLRRALYTNERRPHPMHFWGLCLPLLLARAELCVTIVSGALYFLTRAELCVMGAYGTYMNSKTQVVLVGLF